VALLAAPATAQYGRDEQETKDDSEKGGGIWETIKGFVVGGDGTSMTFAEDPTGAILNITDVNYKETIFTGEYIVTFCSVISAPCADYYPTFMDAAITLRNESNTKFAAVWVEENPRLAARFFVPARLPYVVYAKDGDFRQIPYVRNDTQYLVNFIEEEHYQYYPIMNGPMSPYSTLSGWFEKYAEVMEWVGQYTAWMPWMVYIIAGSMSGVVFSLFSGGSMYSSDPSKYPHLNPDGSLKTDAGSDATATEGSSSATKSKPSKPSSSTTKKRSTKKA
ncbi:hypothetical protein BGZ65_011238, partial [Modicella reniformis]